MGGKTSVKPAPSKWYIYCTNGNILYDLSKCGIDDLEQKVKEKKNKRFILSDLKSNNIIGSSVPLANRKVVAEFTLNEINCLSSIRYKVNGAFYQYNILKKSCLTQEQILNYVNGKDLYALRIEDLKIYDEPKELREFSHEVKYGNWFHKEPLTRPPQSWCYVND